MMEDLGSLQESSLKHGYCGNHLNNGVEQNPPATGSNTILRFKIYLTVKFIGFSNSTASGPQSIIALEVDGRLLVDQGVWDNSRNWSGGLLTQPITTTQAQ